MAIVPGFIGPTNVLRSPNADVERTINLFLESPKPGEGKSDPYLSGTPGIHPEQVLADAPVRALFTQDGRSFAVAGSSFFELISASTNTFYGTVATDANLATMCSNGSAGHQVMVTSGGLVYIFDLLANTLTLVTTGLEPVTMGEFMDGYFLLNTTNTRTFGWSALEDGTTWDVLDVAERSEGSDNIVAMVRSHREIWLLGSLTSEVWFDQGDLLNPFAPIQGVFIEQGCGAPFSVQRIDNTLIWIGANIDGVGIVWRAQGYIPQRISDNAVERIIELSGQESGGGALYLMRAWCYQEDGHLFYICMIPRGVLAVENTSPTYDVSTGMWIERALWDSTHCVWLPDIAQCHTFAFAKHLLGDRLSGAIYQQSLEFYDAQIVTP